MENYDYMYNNTYEAFTYAPINTRTDYTLQSVIISVGTLLLLAVSLAHIVICVSVPKVRADPSKWLQLLVVLSISISAVIDIVNVWGEHTGLNKIWTAPGLCEVVQPISLALSLLVTIGLNLVSLERLVTLWKEVATGSAFSQRATAILLAVTVGVTLVLSYSLIHGFGGVSVATHNGINFCVYDSVALYHITNSMNSMGVLIILILSLFLIGRLCKTNCYGGGRYPLDKVLPVIVGNLLYIVLDGLLASVAYIAWAYIRWAVIMVLTAVLLIWLLGQSDLRRPLTRTCCPCCPPEEDDEKRPILPH